MDLIDGEVSKEEVLAMLKQVFRPLAMDQIKDIPISNLKCNFSMVEEHLIRCKVI